jgi:septal ring factor EnvC (AmiA/AmiB activator)
MKSRRLATILTAFILGASTAAMAASIGERVNFAQQRIEQGIRSGSLTRDEASRLRDELNRVRHDESRAMRDGRLDRSERERLNTELARLERHISQLKNNDEQRRNKR